ncbi:unnamed protein product [Medioppia subpectinata]|uniref:Fatty acid desaturase domain-containing protein n=1 Tax=Medioppia subpectinata TaxID=1979941 RepID=A0A7R9KSH6_9ACAR|nr:unnamed protein product [Medioppia subpectinata]CAG2108965.1 unnamed protein product [Medioppia subpectinata]
MIISRTQTENILLNNKNQNNNNVIITKPERVKYVKPAKIVPHQFEIAWFYVFFLPIIHSIAVYALYLHFTKGIGGWSELGLNVYYVSANILCMFGIIAGAHRLWSHRAYKAKWPLRLILGALQTATIQEDIYEWSLKHRLHHKFSDTDGDPTNISRGFLWAHIGWLFFKRHPTYLAKVPTIDTKDLHDDPIVKYQRMFYTFWVVLVRGTMFTVIPRLLFPHESWTYLVAMNVLFYVILLHYTWLVNSVAHMFGYRPYDKSIQPTDNTVLVYLAMGGGYHNYHHAFPQDYSGSEYGWEQNFNPTTLLIDMFAKIGWAYDRKKVSAEIVRMRTKRTGDTTALRRNASMAIDVVLGLLILYWPLPVIYDMVSIYVLALLVAIAIVPNGEKTANAAPSAIHMTGPFAEAYEHYSRERRAAIAEPITHQPRPKPKFD